MNIYILLLVLLFNLIYSEQCGILPKEIYNIEQSVEIQVDYFVVQNNIKIPVNRNANIRPSNTLVGLIDYCPMMDTRKDATFYSAILSFDVVNHHIDTVQLCFIEFYDKTDSIQTKIKEDPFACLTSTILDGKLEFQLKDILRNMLTKPQGTLTLFTMNLLQDHPSNHVILNVKDTGKLELIIPSISIPPPMPQVPSTDGNDYQHLFPGSQFYHVCTIPDEELEQGYTNPADKCYGRDVYVYKPLQTNPLGPCIKVYTDGMPTEGAMHHNHINNKVSLPDEEPYVSYKYCYVVISTRLGSGTNTPTPPIDAWNWNLYNQQREQLRFLQWARSLSPNAYMQVYSHDRDSIQTQFNSFQSLIDSWAISAGHELIPVQHNMSVLWDSWISVCKPGEEIPGVCSESTLGNGFPASHKPEPACDLGRQFGIISPLESCNCTDLLFTAPFFGEFTESIFIHRENIEGYRDCMWRNYGYEDNYEYYHGLENPNSPIRKCLSKWRDPFTDQVIPATGFLLGGLAFDIPTYDFNTCQPINSHLLDSFNPQYATFHTVLPPEELAIFSYGAECETRFNSSEEQLNECLMRREYKSLDPQGATFNTPYHTSYVIPHTGLTGTEMFYQGNQAFKNGPNTVKFVLYHSGPGGMLNANADPDYLRTFDNTQVIEGRAHHSHFFVVDNPYAFKVREVHVDILNGIIPSDTTL